MLKNFSIALTVIAVSFVGLHALPVSALSIDDVQAQISKVMAQIADLTAELNKLRAQQGQQGDGSDQASASRLPNKARICTLLARNLSLGARGDDVASLQEFLRDQGYLNASATGFYGPLTIQAVAKWQSSEGVSAVGAFGPMSRERLRIWCGGTDIGTFSASPTSGAAPLAVQFTYHPKTEENGQYYIDYGDGQADVMTVNPITCIRAPCISPSSASHTYATVGTYTASVSRYIACLYSNPRCMIAQPAPLARAKIVVTNETNTGNKPPAISALSGPTTLAEDATGTWTVSARDPEGGSLRYQVWWGDENAYAADMTTSAAAQEFTQSATFTHAYAHAGTYTIAITVRDSAGREAKTTSTVRVGSISGAVCPMDAMQCPNGQWVGRTGPQCQFVCN